MNRNDLFDEEPEQPRQERSEGRRRARAGPPPSAPPPTGWPPSDPGGGPLFSRRQLLRGAGAAAVAGAVVGAGAAYGLGALSGEEAQTGAVAVSETDGMTLGVPSGRLLSQAVVRLNINGTNGWVSVKTNETLAEVLRRTLGLTGTKIGCDRSECGACTVLVDGVPMNSCSLLAVREEGKAITTIEGLSANGELSTVQQAFLDNMGLQCGFCTPGQILQATALLQKSLKPSEAAIRRYMAGNLCKCGAYANILTAIQKAAEKTVG